MYQRRVQVTGGGTYLVTLPKEWATELGVEQGSTLSLVITRSGGLLLLPPAMRERNRCQIVMDGKTSVQLLRDIIAHYIAGYEVIEVVGRRIRPEERRTIREIAQSLVGMEILGETQSAVTLGCVANVRDFPVDGTIRRIYSITEAMWEDALQAFLSRDEELAQDVVERDGDVDRLALLVARQFGLLLRDLLLEEEVGRARQEFWHYQSVSDQLERVADHAVKVCRAALALVSSPLPTFGDRLRELAQVSRGVIAEAIRAFAERDPARANAVLEGKERPEEVWPWVQAAARDQPENALPLSIAADSLLRIREHGYNIAETALDISVPSPHYI
ncbi:MAG: AbrB/MazE/SpoVT family DNA-binding domain-containing protein [Candidatus Bipolaricaulota bacterium]|nr:AbrB/MazE/SpoVT family DNA-binding domain-containing protein [Candidatus Bipolaricaulota bacterium]MDW8127272.1 PhoU domain-containing protein [Candidatus Bipolaricaulota bacterium]